MARRGGKEEVMASVALTVLTNDDGYGQDGIAVTCSQCNHQVECFGTTVKSERRACVRMAEECPLGEGDDHWYTTRNIEDARE